jgi:ParB/RepB/Spo0J family partition protein
MAAVRRALGALASLYKKGAENMPSVLSRPLDWFKEDPSNLRKSYDLEELRLLHDSLVKKQLVPLICRPCGTIIDGHRRFRAARIDGRPPQLDTVIVEGNVTEAQVKEIQLITRLHSADLKPFEVYYGCKEWLKHHPGAAAKELAVAISRSEAYVSKVLSLDRCCPPVKEAAAAGKIGLSDWAAISKVPEAEQLALLEAKQGGATRDELESRGRKARNGGQPEVRISRFKYPLPSGVEVTVAGKELSLDELIESLTELAKEARRASDQGLDIRTLVAVARDKARKGASRDDLGKGDV